MVLVLFYLLLLEERKGGGDYVVNKGRGGRGKE